MPRHRSPTTPAHASTSMATSVSPTPTRCTGRSATSRRKPSSRSAWPSASPRWPSPRRSSEAGSGGQLISIDPNQSRHWRNIGVLNLRRAGFDGSPPSHRTCRLPGASRARQRPPDDPVRLHRRLAHVRLHAARLLLPRQDARSWRRRRLQRLCAAERAKGDEVRHGAPPLSRHRRRAQATVRQS